VYFVNFLIIFFPIFSGEFSPLGRGGTPFAPQLIAFSRSPGTRMVDALISDFTINSLLYHLHRFTIVFRFSVFPYFFFIFLLSKENKF
jgi:hypothetical protein